MTNHSSQTRFIERILRLINQLNEQHLEIGQISGDCLPGGISAEDRRELRAAAECLRFMDEMPGGFFICRAAGEKEMLHASGGVLRICQCDTLKEFRELTGNSFRGLVCAEDLEPVEESIRRQIAAGQHDFDNMAYRVRRKDGSFRRVEDYGHFIHNESIGDVFYAFWSDSPGRREPPRMPQNRILTDAREEAELAAKAKEAVLSQVSLEMYTPLNAVLGFTALARTSLHDPDALCAYLEQVETAGYHLLDMVTEALEKIEQAAL